MKLTSSQLRKIIKEEVSNLKAQPAKFDIVAWVNDPNRTQEQLETAHHELTKSAYGVSSSTCPNDIEELKAEIVDLQQSLDSEGQVTESRNNMKLTPAQLRNIIREEVKKVTSGKKNLSEAMTRITEDEVAAWKKGDWGYVAGDAVSEPGHDHEEFLHGSDDGHPHDDEGYMVKSRMSSMKKMAEDICGLLDSDDQLPGWVQDLVATSHSDLQHVYDYLTGDVEMKSHEQDPGHGEPLQQVMPVESRNRKVNNLNESHSRVTQEEMRAWMRGDWGFVSETDSSQED